MREIKFRGKRIDANKFPSGYQWVYGQYFKTPLTDENSGTSPESGWFFLSGEPRHCIVQDGVSFVIDVNTLGQFTGSYDTDDKEIYEGDIVFQDFYDNRPLTIGGFTGEVKFCEGSWWIDNNFNHAEPLWNEVNINEVIGNVHDNPDLLK